MRHQPYAGAGLRRMADILHFLARRGALVTVAVFVSSSVHAAQLLSSVQLIDGGRILSCDYELASDVYMFTCDDRNYPEFALQCFLDVDWPLLPSATPVERFGVICPVTPEPSAQGNALHLGCVKYTSKDLDWQRTVTQEDPALAAGRRIRKAQCASEKINVDWNVFYGAAERRLSR
jgi:hypothetical protein